MNTTSQTVKQESVISINQDEHFYKSGDAAKILGVSIQTLRNWQELGILIPEKVFPSGHRRYSEQQLIDFIKLQEREVVD